MMSVNMLAKHLQVTDLLVPVLLIAGVVELLAWRPESGDQILKQLQNLERRPANMASGQCLLKSSSICSLHCLLLGQPHPSELENE